MKRLTETDPSRNKMRNYKDLFGKKLTKVVDAGL